MVKSRNRKWTNKFKNNYLLERVNKLLGANNSVEALFPVRLFGLCLGVMPFDFIVKTGNISAVLSIPSTAIAIACIVSYAYCTRKFFENVYRLSSDIGHGILKINRGFIINIVGSIGLIFNYISVFTSRHADAKTVQVLTEIDKVFKELNEKQNFSKIKINNICRMVLIFFIEIIRLSVNVYLRSILMQLPIYESIVIEFAIKGPYFVTSVVVFIFRSYIGLLYETMRSLNRLLLNLLKSQNRRRVSLKYPLHNTFISMRDYSERLKTIYVIHSKICDCTENINRAFGKRNLFYFSLAFVQIVMDVFSVFTTIVTWADRGVNVNAYYLWHLMNQILITSCFLCDTIIGCEDCKAQVIF